MANCPHDATTTKYDHVRCNQCGAIHTDSQWGVASNRWFDSREDARFFKANGRLPAPQATEGGEGHG